MRRILVDCARRHRSAKRRQSRLRLSENISGAGGEGADLLVMDEALAELERGDPRKARVIEMKYFGGMTGEAIAAALGVGTATVTRDLRTAEAWIRSFLTSRPEGERS